MEKVFNQRGVHFRGTLTNKKVNSISCKGVLYQNINDKWGGVSPCHQILPGVAPEKNCWGASAVKVPTVSGAKEF